MQQGSTISKYSLYFIAFMSIVFMPLANRQSAWMMLVILFLFGVLYKTEKIDIWLAVRKSIACKISLFWIIIYTAYLVYAILTKGTEGIRIYYFSSTIWLIAGIFFYSLSLSDRAENGLKLLIKVSLFFLILLLLRTIYLYLFRVGEDGVSEEFKNTIPYYLLYLSTPMLLIKGVRKYIMLSIIIFIILLTAKRGPLVAMLIAGGITYFILYKKSFLFKVFTVATIALVASFIGLVIFPDIILNVFERLSIGEISSVEDLDRISSSRLIFWTILYDYWSQADSLTKFFGFGLNAVPEYLEMLTFHKRKIFAHSDWVDTMFNLGQFGLVIFSIFHFCLICEIYRAVKNKNIYAKYMLFNYLIFAFSNFYTGSLVSFSSVWFAFFFYYFAAKTRRINDINNSSSI